MRTVILLLCRAGEHASMQPNAGKCTRRLQISHGAKEHLTPEQVKKLRIEDDEEMEDWHGLDTS